MALGGRFPHQLFYSPLAVTAALVVPGALAAWDRELPLWSVSAVAALLGLAAGAVNGAAMNAAGLGARGVLGAAGMAFVCATLAAAVVVSLQGGWQRTRCARGGELARRGRGLALGWTLKG